MALNWNDNYTQFSFVQYLLHEIAAPFNEAILEREFFAKVTTDFDPADGNVVPAPTVDGRSELWFWLLYGRIEVVAARCVRRYNLDGSEYNPTAFPVIDSALIHAVANIPDLDWDDSPLTFPYPNGWKRRFPREIYKLSYPGSDGQRARFVNLGYKDPFTHIRGIGHWWMAKTTDAEYDQDDKTPDGEEVNQFKFFDRVSGAWVLSVDQDTYCDIVEEFITGEASHTWSPKSGDLLDWTNLNDLRDALNQTVKFIAASEVLDSVVTPVGEAGGFGSAGTQSWVDVQYKGYQSAGPESLADAQAAYNATVITVDAGPTDTIPDPIDGAGIMTFTAGSYPFDPDLGTWQAFSAEAKPFPVLNGPSSLTAKVKTLIKTNAEGDFDVFDAYGDGTNESGASGVLDNWIQVGAELTQLVTIKGNLIGSVKAVSPVPWYFNAPASGGWTLRSTIMLYDLRVAGGFKWTELS